eukprot:4159497-Pyramimonas_sp.AAC.1
MGAAFPAQDLQGTLGTPGAAASASPAAGAAATPRHPPAPVVPGPLLLELLPPRPLLLETLRRRSELLFVPQETPLPAAGNTRGGWATRRRGRRRAARKDASLVTYNGSSWGSCREFLTACDASIWAVAAQELRIDGDG